MCRAHLRERKLGLCAEKAGSPKAVRSMIRSEAEGAVCVGPTNVPCCRKLAKEAGSASGYRLFAHLLVCRFVRHGVVELVEVDHPAAVGAHRQHIGEAVVPQNLMRLIIVPRENLIGQCLVGTAEQADQLGLHIRQALRRLAVQRAVFIDAMHHRPRQRKQ
jgi:hypothetical protein